MNVKKQVSLSIFDFTRVTLEGPWCAKYLAFGHWLDLRLGVARVLPYHQVSTREYHRIRTGFAARLECTSNRKIKLHRFRFPMKNCIDLSCSCYINNKLTLMCRTALLHYFLLSLSKSNKSLLRQVSVLVLSEYLTTIQTQLKEKIRLKDNSFPKFCPRYLNY